MHVGMPSRPAAAGRASPDPRVRPPPGCDRDRRSGLTLIDGAARSPRLDRGVEVTEVFVCEPLWRADARAALDALRPGRHGAADQPGGLRQSRSANGPRVSSRSRASRRPICRRAIPTTPSSSSSRAWRNRAISVRSCEARTARGADAVIAASPRTDLFNPNTIRKRGHGLRPAPGRSLDHRRAELAPGTTSGSSAARVDAEAL